MLKTVTTNSSWKFKEPISDILDLALLRNLVITEASNHPRMATHSLILKVIDEVKSQYLRFNDFEKLSIHLWSDGCASQFRSRFVFHLTVFFTESYQSIRYYNERHHGKGPMDGIEGLLKNVVFRAVVSEKVVIHSPEAFAHYADSNIKGVSVLFMPTSEITEEPDFNQRNTLRRVDMHAKGTPD